LFRTNEEELQIRHLVKVVRRLEKVKIKVTGKPEQCASRREDKTPNTSAFLCMVALPSDIGLSDPPGGLYN
jgi:hypothetical protein